MGRGLPGVVQAVPQSRLQRVPEELAAAHQAVRLQGGQHPAAGGRLALPPRSDTLPVARTSRPALGIELRDVFAVRMFQRGLASPSDPSQVTCRPETSWLVWPTESLTALSIFATAPTLCTHLSREYTCTWVAPHLSPTANHRTCQSSDLLATAPVSNSPVIISLAGHYTGHYHNCHNFIRHYFTCH